jgi:methyl-accepting chemotaxis protein
LAPDLTATILTGALTLSVLNVVSSGHDHPELQMAMLIALSLLAGYRRWKLPVAMGASFMAAQVWQAWPLPAGTFDTMHAFLHGSPFLLLAMLLVQTYLLARAAIRSDVADRERFDVEFLVRAMGHSGPIRLNLDVLKAESPLGQRLKHVQERMGRAMMQVSQSTVGVHRASEVMKDSGSELMQRTENSANGLRDVAMCLEQINVIVKANAEAALDARATADNASRLAKDTGSGITQMVAQMGEIDRTARKITEIIGVINSIAFQTNILALNAAVEAARAGEAGRGFAVVASEVRNLANRSSAAAGEIKGLITESMQAVEAGNQLATQAGDTMNQLVTAVDSVSAVFNNLSADTDEHANSIDAVNAAVRELDGMTQQNLSLAERAEQVARDLVTHAGSLTEVLGAFQLSGSLAAESDRANRTERERTMPMGTSAQLRQSAPASEAAPVVEFF